MKQVVEITSDYRQRHLLPIDGSEEYAYLTLEFKTNLNCWFYSITWGDFVTNNEQLTSGGNLLRQYQKIIPFGIVVLTSNLLDPVTLDAFTSGIASLYTLNASEVASVESLLHG